MPPAPHDQLLDRAIVQVIENPPYAAYHVPLFVQRNLQQSLDLGNYANRAFRDRIDGRGNLSLSLSMINAAVAEAFAHPSMWVLPDDE